MKKRLTVMVSEDIDRIRSKIYEETGVFVTLTLRDVISNRLLSDIIDIG